MNDTDSNAARYLRQAASTPRLHHLFIEHSCRTHLRVYSTECTVNRKRRGTKGKNPKLCRTHLHITAPTTASHDQASLPLGLHCSHEFNALYTREWTKNKTEKRHALLALSWPRSRAAQTHPYVSFAQQKRKTHYRPRLAREALRERFSITKCDRTTPSLQRSRTTNSFRTKLHKSFADKTRALHHVGSPNIPDKDLNLSGIYMDFNTVGVYI